MSIDVLASERGPSCSKISQLPNLKLIHVRFVMNTSKSSTSSQSLSGFLSHSRPVEFSKPISVSRVSKPISVSRVAIGGALTPPMSVPSSANSHGVKRKSSPQPSSKKIPKSLPVTAMFKLGKPINATESMNETIEVSVFKIDGMVWSALSSVDFAIEKEEFSRGGFRTAHKATSNSPHFEGKTCVVKFFLPKTVDIIETQIGETKMDHARKSVQMHSLAKHFTKQIAAKLQKEGKKEVYGKIFRYNWILELYYHTHYCLLQPLTFRIPTIRYVDVYLGVVKETNEIVTIEEYADGNFVKYVNNDGTRCKGNNEDQQMKAESLVHYSYIKSNKKMLMVDIQGANFNLTDPEIATLSGHSGKFVNRPPDIYASKFVLKFMCARGIGVNSLRP